MNSVHWRCHVVSLRKNSDISVTFSVLMIRDGCGCNSSQDKMNTYCFELYMHCVCTDTHRRMSRSHRSCSFNSDMSDAGDLWNENLNTLSLTHSHTQTKGSNFSCNQSEAMKREQCLCFVDPYIDIKWSYQSVCACQAHSGSLYLKYSILRKAFLVLILHLLFYFPCGLVCVESMVN